MAKVASRATVVVPAAVPKPLSCSTTTVPARMLVSPSNALRGLRREVHRRARAHDPSVDPIHAAAALRKAGDRQRAADDRELVAPGVLETDGLDRLRTTFQVDRTGPGIQEDNIVRSTRCSPALVPIGSVAP